MRFRGTRLGASGLPVCLVSAVLALALMLMAATANAQPHVGEYVLADIQRGAQLFRTHCTNCHGDAGTQVPGVNVLSGRFRRATSDEELGALIREGIPEAGMPPGEYIAEQLTAFVAYLRSAPGDLAADAPQVAAGDPQRGRELFYGQAECTMCHRIDGVGGYQGPNLSAIATIRTRSSLLQSLVTPSAEIIPLNREIGVVTAQGRTITGRRMNEDTYSFQLIDREGRLYSFLKADLRDMRVLETSSMPAYGDRLTDSERADIVAYLQSLGAVN